MNLEQSDTPILVSVIVLAYNNLHLTKQCVESLYQYTTDVPFELITINNGSTDGTEAYFQQLPNQKKISFSENVGVDFAINFGIRKAEGKYTINLSNDIIVTKNWLSNLVRCMMSDPTIGMVVPTCSASSNIQQVNLKYDTIDEMQVEAEKFNHTNPLRWEERLRLVTYTCLFPTDLLQQIGGFDEDFNPGAYDDDAISFRIRRAGYKLYLAADTFVHHFGSATFQAEYKQNNLIQRNKELFFKKFGVHSWGAGKIDFGIVNSVVYDAFPRKSIRILGVGGSCGASLLQVKNMFRKMGNLDVIIDYLTEEEATIPDLRSLCARCVFGRHQNVKSLFSGNQYDLVIVESETAFMPRLHDFYTDICTLLGEKGQLVTTANPVSLPQIATAVAPKGLIQKGEIEDHYYMFANM